MENTIGERIVNLRKLNGLTQLQLAEKLNISDKAVSKWESSKGDPSLEMLELLSNLFDCSIDYLVKGKENIKIIEKKSPEYIDSFNNIKTHIEIVFDKMLEKIKYEISELSYDIWIKSIVPVDLISDGANGEYTFIMEVSSQTVKHYISKNYYSILMNVLSQIDNKIKNIEFIVNNPFIDPYFKIAMKIAIENQSVSTSFLQRRLNIGYSRAAEIIDLMEDKNYVSSLNGRKMRDVYIDKAKYEEIFKEKFDNV